jgi:hypothetical protein
MEKQGFYIGNGGRGEREDRGMGVGRKKGMIKGIREDGGGKTRKRRVTGKIRDDEGEMGKMEGYRE